MVKLSVRKTGYGYQGLCVVCNESGRYIYQRSTGITRLDKQTALDDAKKMFAEVAA